MALFFGATAISRFALNTPTRRGYWLAPIHRAYRLLACANTPLVALSPVGDTGSGYGYFALCAQYAYAARLLAYANTPRLSAIGSRQYASCRLTAGWRYGL